jgi:hypothetical protein
MKNLIRKILREDFDWTKEINPVEDYLSWLNETHGQSWSRDFDEVVDIMGYLSSDASTMLQLGRIVEDTNQTTKRRLEALLEYNDYTNMNVIIENHNKYFDYIVDYSDISGLSEHTVVEMANKLVERNR